MTISILLLVLVFCFCKEEKTFIQNDIIKKYIHLSHTRSYNNQRITVDIENLPYDKYDITMLGGDMMDLTSIDSNAIELLDNIVKLDSKTTLWSLGNHDYSDIELIKNYTKRENYYVYHQNEITFLVLDTQLDSSKVIGSQLEFTRSVLDTISESSHVIIVTHHLLWMADTGYLATIADSVSNAPLSDCWYCIQPNNFYSEIYPLLISLENQGIETLCIAGDLGYRVNEFEYTTAEGIQFLASGVIFSKPEQNQILEFTHNVTTKTLDWEYKLVKELTK